MFASTVRFPRYGRGSYLNRVSAVIARGKRPVPFRTRKLSLSAPMVLQGGPCGRVGRCRTFFQKGPPHWGGPFCFHHALATRWRSSSTRWRPWRRLRPGPRPRRPWRRRRVGCRSMPATMGMDPRLSCGSTKWDAGGPDLGRLTRSRGMVMSDTQSSGGSPRSSSSGSGGSRGSSGGSRGAAGSGKGGGSKGSRPGHPAPASHVRVGVPRPALGRPPVEPVVRRRQAALQREVRLVRGRSSSSRHPPAPRPPSGSGRPPSGSGGSSAAGKSTGGRPGSSSTGTGARPSGAGTGSGGGRSEDRGRAPRSDRAPTSRPGDSRSGSDRPRSSRPGDSRSSASAPRSDRGSSRADRAVVVAGGSRGASSGERLEPPGPGLPGRRCAEPQWGGTPAASGYRVAGLGRIATGLPPGTSGVRGR